MISRAQASSASTLSSLGLHVKMRRRLGVSSGTVPLNGPEMYSMSMPGRSAGTFGEGAESVKPADTSRVPAPTCTRISSS